MLGILYKRVVESFAGVKRANNIYLQRGAGCYLCLVTKIGCSVNLISLWPVTGLCRCLVNFISLLASNILKVVSGLFCQEGLVSEYWQVFRDLFVLYSWVPSFLKCRFLSLFYCLTAKCFWLILPVFILLKNYHIHAYFLFHLSYRKGSIV